jgi:hypothetical protein
VNFLKKLLAFCAGFLVGFGGVYFLAGSHTPPVKTDLEKALVNFSASLRALTADLGPGTKIVKMSDDWYLAEKKLPFFNDKKQMVGEKPVYFSLERIPVDDPCTDTWQEFCDYQTKKNSEYREGLKLLFQLKKITEVEKEHVLGVLASAQNALGFLCDYVTENANLYPWQHKGVRNGDLWIAYAAKEKPEKPFREVTSAQAATVWKTFLMTVAVRTDDAVPFQVHMGISQPPILIYKRSEYALPQNLSVELHAFAARALQQRGREKGVEKVYVLTRPLFIMNKILRENLGDACILWGVSAVDAKIKEKDRRCVVRVVTEGSEKKLELLGLDLKTPFFSRAILSEEGDCNGLLNAAGSCDFAVLVDKLAKRF